MNITACHLCGSMDLGKILDLGFHPLADTFLKVRQLATVERRYPLSVLLCKSCGHAMNSYVVPAEERYQENEYSYDSSNSKIAIKHFSDMADEIVSIAGVRPEDLVVDIGSNVGTLLKAFGQHGVQIQGVDPAANIVAIAEKNGIPTIGNFFNFATCTEILKRGKAKVIVATNCFNHIAYLDDFMWAVTSILRDDGVFVVEVPYFLRFFEKRSFDTVYLEHISYFSVKPLAAYVKKFGLAVMRAEENDYMSDSIRIFIGRGEPDDTVAKLIVLEEGAGLASEGTYREFAQQVLACKLDLVSKLTDVRRSGGKAVGIGAATKGNTLLNYCGIDSSLIAFVTDASPLKIGKYTPGSHIPIRPDSAIDESVTHAVILPWNIADFLKSKISPQFPKLEFIVPHVAVEEASIDWTLQDSK